MTKRFVVPDGVELVLHDVAATDVLPGVLDTLGHQKVFIVCSRTLRRTTDVVDRIVECLGARYVGITDEVGEYAPLSNVLAAAVTIRDSGADVVVTIGGGSAMDFTRAVQLAVSEDVYTKDELLARGAIIFADDGALIATSTAQPRLRQIAIPTSLRTADWSPTCACLDDETHRKSALLVPRGAPQVIIYDPEIAALAPRRLLLSTGIRGLDHAANTACVVSPHPLTSLLAEKAATLFIENLPRIARDPADREAMTNCQLANWYTGTGQMSIAGIHGFSHGAVLVVAPAAAISQSDAGCLLMLAQARWLEGLADPPNRRISAALGRPDESFSSIVLELLLELGMPTSLDDLSISDEKVEEIVPLFFADSFTIDNNVRPITSEDDVREIFALIRH